MTFRTYVFIGFVILPSLSLIACSSEEVPATVESVASGAETIQAPQESPAEPAVNIDMSEAGESMETEVETAVVSEDEAEVVEEEAPTQIAPEALAHKDGLPDGLGKEEFETICSDCHAVDTAISTRRSQAEWQVVIQEMRGMGAEASNIEAGLILAYLSQNFGT